MIDIFKRKIKWEEAKNEKQNTFSTIKEQNVDYTQIKIVKIVKKPENLYGNIKK